MFIIILVWGILLKMNRFVELEANFSVAIKRSYYERFTLSLNPFDCIETTPIQNILNILVFIPFGFFSTVFLKNKRILKVFGISLGLSITFEVIQLFTALGGFSTIDIITNTIGGLIGCLIYLICEYIIQKIKNKNVKYNLIKLFIIICYVLLIFFVSFAIINTVIHIDFYINLYKKY